MNPQTVDTNRVTIPRWTIRRDPRVLGCPLCGSAIVRIKADRRQVAFCECRLLEDRVMPSGPRSQLKRS
jgi:hypothetical protein